MTCTPNNCTNNEYHACKERLLELEEAKATGMIIRWKVKILEQGEKSTKYFFGLENINAIKKQVWKLALDNGKIITIDDDILKRRKVFEKRYKSKVFDVEDDCVEALCNNNTIPELTKSEQEMCEEVITEKECIWKSV